MSHTSLMKRGNLIRNGVKIQPQEESAVEFLLSQGLNVELIVPVNTPKNKNPDFLINGVVWELKSPETKNKKTIKRLINSTTKQSVRIVVDLKNLKLNEEIAINILEYEFRDSRRVRDMMIIPKRRDALLRYKK